MGSNLALEYSSNCTVFGLVNRHLLETDRFIVLQGDLLGENVLEGVINRVQPWAVIHCAGLTRIDDCERNPEKAYHLNAEVPGRVAEITSQQKIKLLHISTATVFDGKSGQYTEEDIPHPLSVYAKSKLEGERSVLARNPDALIARVSMFGWSPSGERSLAEFFFNHLQRKRRVTGFTDVMFCPLFVNHLAPIFWRFLEGDFRGLYHVVGTDCVSKYKFGYLIAEKFGFDPQLIQPGSVEEMDLLGARSHDLRLDNRKMMRDLHLDPPKLSTGLEEFYTLYQQGYPQFMRGMFESSAVSKRVDNGGIPRSSA